MGEINTKEGQLLYNRAKKVIPGGTLCMYSAWFHYNLTTQIPSEYCVAIQKRKAARYGILTITITMI